MVSLGLMLTFALIGSIEISGTLEQRASQLVRFANTQRASTHSMVTHVRWDTMTRRIRNQQTRFVENQTWAFDEFGRQYVRTMTFRPYRENDGGVRDAQQETDVMRICEFKFDGSASYTTEVRPESLRLNPSDFFIESPTTPAFVRIESGFFESSLLVKQRHPSYAVLSAFVSAIEAIDKATCELMIERSEERLEVSVLRDDVTIVRAHLNGQHGYITHLWRSDPSQGGLTTHDISYQETNGSWFPNEGRIRRWVDANEAKNTPDDDWQFRVLSITMNDDIPEELFELRESPGLAVIDHRYGTQHIVGAETDFSERVSKIAQDAQLLPSRVARSLWFDIGIGVMSLLLTTVVMHQVFLLS